MTIFGYFLRYMYMNIFAFFVMPFLVALLCGMSKNITHITFLTKKVIILFFMDFHLWRIVDFDLSPVFIYPVIGASVHSCV